MSYPWSTEQSIADAWRGSLAEVDECLYWIKEHLQSIEKHSASSDLGAYVRKRLKARLCTYLRAIKRVSEYEEWMTRHHVMFNRNLKQQRKI